VEVEGESRFLALEGSYLLHVHWYAMHIY
jgi:hypothetical protein